MDSDLTKVAALSRPFTLGMLYDARKDLLIPGWSLWDNETLQGKITESSKRSSAFEISASDSIESKSSLLNVEASLKASFLSGLIEVEGSAKYLNDQKKFKNQSRVTCQYKATTHFKQLSMIDLATLDTHQTEVIKKNSATHVVTGILYGTNAFFVFDTEKLESNSVQEIEGNMKAVIKKIPSLNIEGEVGINLTEEEQNLTKKFSCKFYGDLILDSNPTTFADAVKTYAELPKKVGDKGENAVPVKVWLTPLKNLSPEADELVSGISAGLLWKMQSALQDFKDIRMRSNDSLEDEVVENFPQIKRDLSTFQKLCGYYTTNLQQAMAKKIPSIREGEEDESSAKQLFEDRDNSPFSHEKLSKWLDQKEREITVIISCVDTMKGTKIVHNQSELDREVTAAGVQDALCFVFTSMESADPCLDEMANDLQSLTVECTNEDPWYFSDEVFIEMKNKAKAFHVLTKAQENNSKFCFIIAAIENEKYKGATIYHYRDGILVSEDFSKPDLAPEKITDKRDLIWHACDLTLDPNTVHNRVKLSHGNKKATHVSCQNYADHPERFANRTQVLCKEGLSGRHYWEVEWSVGEEKSIYVGVAYKGIDRKGEDHSMFGHNNVSWAFIQYSLALSHAVHRLEIWHNGKVRQQDFPSDCRIVGVYLDWPAGTLSLYKVNSQRLTHLHTFHTKFTEPVYPGLLTYQGDAYLRRVE